jgi:hypothetical protein
MAIGKNEFVTRSYVEGMIRHSSLGETAMLKDVQEKLNVMGFDHDRLRERVESLEQVANRLPSRLDDFLDGLKDDGALITTQQGKGSTLIEFRLNRSINGNLHTFSAVDDTLPDAISLLVEQILEYLQTGKTE